MAAIGLKRAQVRSVWRRVSHTVVAFAVLFANLGLTLAEPMSAVAAPQLSVTASATAQPLLGGRATYRVTVRNIGDAKAYNLSVSDLFGSSRTNPQGKVTFASATDASGVLPVTSTSTNAATGDTTVQFVNIRDLEAGESYYLDLTVSLAGDPTWALNDFLTSAVTATGNGNAAGTGTTYTGTTATSNAVQPIVIVSKVANQSTSVEQVTGTTDRTYSYTITVQNNYVGPSSSLVVTDTVPDGVEYLGMLSGPDPDIGFPARTPTGGETTLRWTLGTVSAGQAITLQYRAGIRYDYYGTANGGTGRVHNDFDPTPAGTPVPDKARLTNSASMSARYNGTPVSDSASSSVTAAYATIGKTAAPSSGGPGTLIDYDLTYVTSEYYSLVASGTSSVRVHDTVPDGQTVVSGSVSDTPTAVSHNSSGTTDIDWLQSALTTSSEVRLHFQTTVDNTWEAPGRAGRNIVAGDSMLNSGSLTALWKDEINPARTGSETSTVSSAGSATFTVPKAGVYKSVRNPVTGNWSPSATATVGDRVHMRVQFNANDTTRPIRNDAIMGSITVTDWLPPGTSLVATSVAASYSASGDFSKPTPSSPTPNISAPTTSTVGGLQGMTWFLGDVAKGGWWQAEFDVVVTDVAAVANGVVVNNLFKMTGLDTAGAAYSDRAQATVTYVLPTLTIAKATVAPLPNPLTTSSYVDYTITVRNTGTATARDLLVTDQLPVGMRNATPTLVGVKLDGVTVNKAGHWTEAYSAATGLFTIDFSSVAAGVQTSIPAGSTLVLTVKARVDSNTGAGASLTNTGTVNYNTQDPPAVGRPLGPVTANATVTLAGLSVTKSMTPATVTIGDTVTCDLTVTVPAGGVAYWPRVVDTFDHRGLTYVAGSASITDISGDPGDRAQFASSATPTTSAVSPSSLSMTWNLSNYINNSGQASPYIFRLRFQAKVTGVNSVGVPEYYPPRLPPASHDTLSNLGSIQWNSTNPGLRPASPDKTQSSSSVRINVDQPWLQIAKTVTTSPPYIGGSVVGYRITVRNVGYSAAHAMVVTDYMGEHMTANTPVVTSVKIGSTTLAAGTGYRLVPPYDPVTGRLTIDLSNTATPSVATSLPAAGTMTIDYTQRISDDLDPMDTIVNTATVGFQSLANGTGRVYSAVTATAAIVAAAPNLEKSVITPAAARIGDLVTFRLRTTIPTGTVTTDTVVADLTTNDGMRYVSGSAALTYVSGSPLIPAVLYSTTESTNAPVPGSTLRFGLYPTAGTAKISSGPTAPYVFDITYQMRVTGLADNGSWIWPPNEPALSSNGSQLSWKDDAGQTATFNGNTVEEPIVQPYLVVAKSCEVATIGPDAVTTSTVTVTNTGDGPAYIVNGRPGLADLMPDHTSIIDLVSVTASPTQSVLASGTDYTWAPSASGFTVDYQQSTSSATVLQPGEALVFVYRWGTDVAVGSGASLVNTASVDWSSMPTTDQAAARTYDATHAAQLPDRVATNTVDVPLASLIKTVAPIDMVAIGQTTTYTVTVSPPLATALYGTVVTDHVPDGLTVVSADSPWGGSVVLGAKLPDGSTPVTWTIGDIANPPHSSLTLDLRVRVDDTFADGTPVNGLPEGVGGRPPDAFVNQATLTWNDAASGRPHVATSEPATVTATEPHLVITKSADATSAAAGGEVTYTLRVNNDGASGAWGVGLQDLIPEPLYAFGSSPQLLSVTRDNVPLTNITDYLYLGTNPFYLLLGDTANGSIPASSTVELTYRCTAQGGLVYGDALTNDAAVTRSYSYSTIQARAYSGPEASVPLETLLPGLVTTKSVQDNVVPRSGVASFTYTVHNVGTAAAHGFTLADAVPPGFTYVAGSTAVSWPSGSSTADPAIIGNAVTGGSLTWSLDATAHAGETLTLTFRAIVGSNAVTGSWTDTCTATALDNAGTPVFPDSQIPADTDLFDRDSATILVTNPHLQVTKARADDPPATVRPGDFVDYVIAVYNDGDTTMTVVPMTDTWDGTKLQYVSAIPPADSTTAGSATWDDITSGILVIEPGAQEEVAVRLLALTGGVDIVDTATVAAAIDVNGDTPPSANDTASVSVTSPGVTVTKTMGDTIVPVGHEVTGTIEVSNSGDTTIAVVPLTDAFNASRLRFDAASPTQSSVVGGLISWADITGGAGLRPGASTSVEITFTAILSGSVPDTATVAGTTDFFGDTVPTSTAEATVTVTNPHVAITKQLAAGQNPFVQLGGRVTYDLVVTNDGDTALITVPMTDTFDALRLLYVGSSRSEDSSSTGVLTWNNLGLLAPGESTTVTVSFDVVAIGSPITDVASLAGVVDVNGDSAPPVTATDTALTGTNPHVAITKTLHPGQSEGVLTGQPVVYDIAITNDGDTILTTVPLVDDFDYYHLEFSSADPVQDDQQDGTIWWNDVTGAGSLAPHETTTVTVSLTAKGAHLSVTDTATVSGATDEHRGVAPTETAANSQVSIVGPGITVVKEIESPGRYVQVGELVVYDIDVFNSGDTTITWAPVTDTFDSEHLEFVSSVPPPDSTTFNTLTWTSIASTQAPITQDREGETYVTFRVIAPSPSIVDTATVAGARDNFGNVIPTQHNDDRQLVGTNPQMSVAKSLAIGQSALIPVGDTVTYSITCTNTGDTDMVSVPLTDVFDSARLAWVSSTPAADSVGTSSASWNDITGGAGLASGEATTVSVTLRATASGVSVTDTATISGAVDEHGGIPPTVSAADSTLSIHKLVPLSIVKTGRDVNGGSLRPGDEILWTITVSNNDVVPSTNTIVYDTIHAPAIYVRGSMTGPGADESGAPNLVWRVGTIPGGAQVVLTVRSKVPVSAGNLTAVSNQAQVISDTSSMMSSSSQSGAVANPTVVFVRTSGNEAQTLALILMLLLGGFGLILPASRRWLPAFVSERVAVARATRMWALAIGTLMLSAALVFGLVLVQPGWADSASGAFARLTAGTSASAPAPTGAGSAVRSRAGARVTIKRIGISTRLVDGTNMGALKRGAWRQPPSARPGEAGNTVIAGHRIKSQFRRLKEARRGDLVTVTYGGYKRRYRVKSIHTVSGRKMSSLLTRGGVETLTLYTCTTMWSGDKRTVVVCTPAR